MDGETNKGTKPFNAVMKRMELMIKDQHDDQFVIYTPTENWDEDSAKCWKALNRGSLSEVNKLMEKAMTPEDIKACEQNEMDKDALEKAIPEQMDKYLKDPLALLDDMDFQSSEEWAQKLADMLKDTNKTHLIPNIERAGAMMSYITLGMVKHARMLAERDLGL